ncbi:hypothetical protein BIY29_07250 [Brenneria alni]|uniref:Type III secretion protein n=1 Tax=Brenneria alni TaxID=71656 RepID=A0A421DQ33_9GAMM|nr:type III secretion protein [Brenneria alni]RLM25302.1 hypothetical protein BIY29_07250 [Brenneria alni]
MNDDPSGLDWINWWIGDCGLQADPVWDEKHFFTPQMRHFIHANPAVFCRYFNLPVQLPPKPEPSLMRLGTLGVGQRAQVLHLMAVVCQPVDRQRKATADQVTWCQRLARALRPGLWLPDCCTFSDDSDALALLRARYGELCWPRLRLLYPRDLTDRCPDFRQSLPTGRLNALCDALIWKVATPEYNETIP